MNARRPPRRSRAHVDACRRAAWARLVHRRRLRGDPDATVIGRLAIEIPGAFVVTSVATDRLEIMGDRTTNGDGPSATSESDS